MIEASSQRINQLSHDQHRGISAIIKIGISKAGTLLGSIAMISVAGAIGLPQPAQAIITTLMDNLQDPAGRSFVNDGFTIQRNVHESDTEISFFFESRGQTYGAPIAVDADRPGDYNQGMLSPGTIPVGTIIASYYFTYDPVGTTNPGVNTYTNSPTITFNRPIGGLIFLDSPPAPTASLDASNSTFANPALTSYATGQFIGVEGAAGGTERIIWSGNTLTFRVGAGFGGVDNVRVLLVPFEFEATTGLVGLGLIAAGSYWQRKRRLKRAKVKHKP
jgi:hypothetical protein